jgi:hypothetical protein
LESAHPGRSQNSRKVRRARIPNLGTSAERA